MNIGRRDCGSDPQRIGFCRLSPIPCTDRSCGAIMPTHGSFAIPNFPFKIGPYGTATLAYDDFRASGPVSRVSIASGRACGSRLFASDQVSADTAHQHYGATSFLY